MLDPQDWYSWFNFLSIDYLDDALCDELSKYEINNPEHQPEIIRMTMESDIVCWPESTRMSMKRTLDHIDDYPEDKVRRILEDTGMPFDEPLRDYKAFFKRVRMQLFPEG